MHRFQGEDVQSEGFKFQSRPDEVLKALALKLGETVADIGSGGGYFAWWFPEAAGKRGKVPAVDTNSSPNELSLCGCSNP